MKEAGSPHQTPLSTYAGFISYSQMDKTWARRIHRALEAYRLPTGMPELGAQRKRLGRFFRDDDELAGAPSLGTALEGAIDDSAALIVICSPNSASSKWVDAEIRRFKRRGPDAKVFAIIVGGRPDATSDDEQCFPPSLLFRVDADGNLTDTPDEPLAPDVSKDSFARLITRVVAGLIGVEFDSLWQRERRRRRRRAVLSGVALACLAAAAVAGFVIIDRANTSELIARAEQRATEAQIVSSPI
ncbi:toll/interleukin-1 receptor domain-containing protein [Aestuariivita boseongensis]|uniref:toll/interleukin-1 receptor domain-containing protein n=1 Tax=Aestuariivita boseongensis TaxID=1470562 RepID=UPI000683058F|nr:toll/interleukin-1 receptor domain-containing protein [Aestuariivita boseongensis]